jgi:hypothetical protein
MFDGGVTGLPTALVFGAAFGCFGALAGFFWGGGRVVRFFAGGGLGEGEEDDSELDDEVGVRTFFLLYARVRPRRGAGAAVLAAPFFATTVFLAPVLVFAVFVGAGDLARLMPRFDLFAGTAFVLLLVADLASSFFFRPFAGGSDLVDLDFDFASSSRLAAARVRIYYSKKGEKWRLVYFYSHLSGSSVQPHANRSYLPACTSSTRQLSASYG